MKFLLASVLLSSAALAAPSAADLRRYSEAAVAGVHDATTQRLLQAAPPIPAGLSQECVAGWQALFSDMAFVDAWVEFTTNNTLACFDLPDPTDFGSGLPGVGGAPGGSNTFKVEPCDAGVAEFTPICEARGGYMCQVSFESSIRGTTPLGAFEFKAIFSSWQCLPQTCSNDDYNAAFAEVSRQASAAANAPGIPEGLEIEVDFALFCDAGNGRPANFGSGSNTRVTINGTVDADAEFTLSCAQCSPAWSVSVDVPANLDGGSFSNLLAAGLNADASFDSANCLSVWINEGQTYNVYCPQDAEITCSFNLETGTGAALLQQDAAQPITNFEGNGIRAEGTRERFETNIVEGTTNSASTLSSSTLAAVALAALVAVAASN